MAESFVIGDPPITVEIRRHHAARRLVLRLSRGALRPVATAPPSLPASRVRAFALEHEGWLRRQLERAPQPVVVGAGVALPFRGRDVVVMHRPGGRTEIADGRLYVSGPPEAAATRAAAFLKLAAREACAAAAERHAARLGRAVTKVSLRDTRGRWGSCNDRGELMFSWRLVMAPPETLDYVAAHEVAHLVELNHSDRFWRVVRDLYGPWERQRAWLRENGHGLMLYDFTGGKAWRSRG